MVQLIRDSKIHSFYLIITKRSLSNSLYIVPVMERINLNLLYFTKFENQLNY